MAKALANIFADLWITEKLCSFVNTPNNMWAGATLANILANPGITETLYVLLSQHAGRCVGRGVGPQRAERTSAHSNSPF